MTNFQINDIVDHLPRPRRPTKGRGKVTGVNQKYGFGLHHLLAVTWYSNGKTTLQGCRTIQLVERVKQQLFTAGDRVSHIKTKRQGVIVQDQTNHTAFVKFDTDSYTKQCFANSLERIPALKNTAPFVVFDEAAPVDPKVYERAGYWHDLALRERDAARAEVKRLHDVCTGFRTELSNQDDEIEKLQKLLATERHYNATLRETIVNGQRVFELKL